jgi:hypothetical protein
MLAQPFGLILKELLQLRVVQVPVGVSKKTARFNRFFLT